MYFRIITLFISTFCFVSCATYQENPNYSYSTSYLHSKNEIVSNSEFDKNLQHIAMDNKSANVLSSNEKIINTTCSNSAKPNKTIGASIGGLVGAVAAKSIVSGKAGAIVGAGLGGVAGYKVGELLSNCNNLTESVKLNELKKDDNSHLLVKTLYSSSDEALVNNNSSNLLEEQVLDEINYDYSANSSLALKKDHGLNITKTTIHKVVKGDTIYSLTKKLCQDIEEIDKLNNLNSNFNIQLGSLLILPPNAC